MILNGKRLRIAQGKHDRRCRGLLASLDGDDALCTCGADELVIAAVKDLVLNTRFVGPSRAWMPELRCQELERINASTKDRVIVHFKVRFVVNGSERMIGDASAIQSDMPFEYAKQAVCRMIRKVFTIAITSGVTWNEEPLFDGHGEVSK